MIFFKAGILDRIVGKRTRELLERLRISREEYT
jgi:hypothetical protein